MKNVLTLMIALSLFACGGNEEEAQAEAEEMANGLAAQLQEAANQAQQQAAQTPTPTQPAAGAGGSNFGTVTLTPGFAPDPATATGTSGGATDASTVNDSCAGWIAATPDHLFVASGAFANLRIMAKSDADTTLVVQAPDGSYMCNDDGEELNPIVTGAFPAGTYKVWIGSYEQGTNSRYTLGLSELDTVMPSTLN